MLDDAWAHGNANISGNAQVFDDTRVYGDAHLYGDARVGDYAVVSGNDGTTAACRATMRWDAANIPSGILPCSTEWRVLATAAAAGSPHEFVRTPHVRRCRPATA